MNADSLPLDLDAIEARCEAATPGPWERRARNRTNGVPIVAGEYIEARVYGDPANAAFIAAARTDVPALVAALRRERERADTLQVLAESLEEYVAGLGPEALKHAVDRANATLERRRAALGPKGEGEP